MKNDIRMYGQEFNSAIVKDINERVKVIMRMRMKREVKVIMKVKKEIKGDKKNRKSK